MPNRFTRLRSRWLLVSLASFAYWTTASSLRPLVPLHVNALGGSTTDVAAAVMVQAAAPLVAATLVGRWVDRTSARRVLQGGAVAMAVVGALYAFSTTVTHLLVLQAGNGLAELAVWVALQTYITRIDDATLRREHLAVFSFVWGLGLTIGPWLGGTIYELAGFSPLGITYALGGLLALVLGRASPKVSQQGSGVAAHARATSTRRPAGSGERATARLRYAYVLTAVGAFFNSLRQSYFPILLDEQGVAVSRIGTVLAVMGLASLVVRLPLGFLCRTLGTRRTVVVGTYGSLVLMGFVPFVSTGTPLVLLAAAMGGLYGVNPPLTVELLAASSAATRRGKAMAGRVISNRIAALVQPVAVSALSGVIGLAAAFPVIGASVVGIGLVAQRTLGREAAGWVRRDAAR